MRKGLFITFEGIDGAGKSLQIELLKAFFIEKKKWVTVVREPGGTVVGERIREILLSPDFALPPWSEVFLFLASRKVMVEEVLKPELERGSILILDRFFDSTFAYQGYGRGLDVEVLKKIHKDAGIDVEPDITFLLDLPPEVAFSRINKGRGGSKTRIEEDSLYFFRKVREGYLTLLKENPYRIKLIDATLSACTIHERIVEILEDNGFV